MIESLPHITVPTLVIVGENDEPFLNGSRYMADKIPDAILVLIAGGDHAPNLSQPEQFEHALRLFLDRPRPSMTTRAHHSSGDSTAVRREASDWVEGNWDPELALVDWRRLLAASGWACPSWPTSSGTDAACRRGRTRWSRGARRRRARSGTPIGSGMALAAPTILAHGADAVARRSCARPSPARTRGASCSASRAAARTSPG